MQPNPSKSEAIIFHLNKPSAAVLKIKFDGHYISRNKNPKYLGITLNRTLKFKHKETLRKKIYTRNNIISKLAGYGWGADSNSFRIASLGLVFAAAKYCVPVQINSQHVSIVQLNKAMRTISETLKTTPLPWFPVMANITPLLLRREKVLRRKWQKYLKSPGLPIYEDIMNLSNMRVKLRNPNWKIVDDPSCGIMDR